MRNSLLRSDLVITVCPTSAVDLWEIESLINTLKKLKSIQGRSIPLLLIFNKVPARHTKSSIEEAIRFFDQNNIHPDFILQSVIKDRAIFKHSVKFGKGVVEIYPQDEKATQEMISCCNIINNYINLK